MPSLQVSAPVQAMELPIKRGPEASSVSSRNQMIDIRQIDPWDIAQAQILPEGGAQHKIAERRQKFSKPNGVIVFEIAEKDRNQHGNQSRLLLVLNITIFPLVILRSCINLRSK